MNRAYLLLAAVVLALAGCAAERRDESGAAWRDAVGGVPATGGIQWEVPEGIYSPGSTVPTFAFGLVDEDGTGYLKVTIPAGRPMVTIQAAAGEATLFYGAGYEPDEWTCLWWESIRNHYRDLSRASLERARRARGNRGRFAPRLPDRHVGDDAT